MMIDDYNQSHVSFTNAFVLIQLLLGGSSRYHRVISESNKARKGLCVLIIFPSGKNSKASVRWERFFEILKNLPITTPYCIT